MKRLTGILLICMLAAGQVLLAAPPRRRARAKAGVPGAKAEIPKDVPEKFVGQEAAWLRSALSEQYLKERMTAIAEEFRGGRKGKMLSVTECALLKLEMERYGKYYFLESDSGIAPAWVESCIKYAEALTQAQGKLNYLISSKQTKGEEYRKWYEYRRKTAGDFVRLAKNPGKSANAQRIAALKKVKKAVLERELAAEAARKAAQPVLK